MKTVWESTFGDTFETEEEAWDDSVQQMEWRDYEDKMPDYVSYERLLWWARQQPGFFEEFESELCQVEEEFFSENYKETDVEEEEE